MKHTCYNSIRKSQSLQSMPLAVGQSILKMRSNWQITSRLMVMSSEAFTVAVLLPLMSLKLEGMGPLGPCKCHSYCNWKCNH